METLTSESEVLAEPDRPRRHGLIVVLAVLVVAGIVLGIWAITESDQNEDLALATEFADTWVEAWLTSDGEAAAALFTEDAVYEMPHYEAVMEGRENIGALVAGWGQWTAEMQHGDVTKVGRDVFVFPVESVGQGQTWVSDMRITFEGDLVSHAISENARQID